MIPNEITNLDDHLDSRDIQERIQWLGATIEEMQQPDPAHPDYAEADAKIREEYEAELSTLNALRTAYIDDYSESSWEFGAFFIRDSYFKDYAQQLAEDCGMIKAENSWPNNCIDWEQAARELQMDYTEIDFDGVDYWTQEA